MKKEKKKINLAVGIKSVLSQLKRFFILWLCAAIVVGIITAGSNLVSSISKGNVTSVVNFSFDGIESGLDPMGNKFDSYKIKDKSNIKAALEELGMDTSDEQIELIQDNISVDGVVPDSIIKDITSYSGIVNSSGLNTTNSINDTSYNPTQYSVTLRYTKTGLGRKEAADVLNNILTQYEEYFYSIYGYNASIESAVRAIDYNDYDYTEAIEVVDSSLKSLKNYIESLSETDNTRFTSKETGYTFSDLSEAIDTIRSENIGWISSYIVTNNVTKDKNNLKNYYQFKIENLTRQKEESEEQLHVIENLVSEYVKTNTVVLGVGDDSKEYSYSQGSETYDDLVNRKVQFQTSVSNYEEEIKLYKDRISKLSSAKSSEGHNETVDGYFESLDAEVENLLDIINKTATEFYTTVDLLNAYQIITPANGSMTSYFVSVMNSIQDSLSYELIVLALYFLAALIFAVLAENGKNAGFRFSKKKIKKKSEKK